MIPRLFSLRFDLSTTTKAFYQDCSGVGQSARYDGFCHRPYSHDGTSGRLFLTTTSSFTHADIEFLSGGGLDGDGHREHVL
jgi:hypothetical protein